MTPYGVTFSELNKGRKAITHKDTACFAGVRNNRNDAIRFICFIANKYKDRPFTEEILDFYLGFMKRIIGQPGCARWKARKLKDLRVSFLLETKDMSYGQWLFYMCWFRYIQEMPGMVFELLDRKQEGDTDEDLFRKFQEIHYECLKGTISSCYLNWNHGLIYTGKYAPVSCGKPITIARMMERIREKPATVFEHFQ